ncbi:MAG: DUF4097 family beta strand repeat-containing protein [Bacteroidota bacterium]
MNLTMRSVYSLLLLLCSLSVFANIKPKDDTRESKSYERSFKVAPDSYLEVKNKYGQIIINTWDKDLIQINAEVTAHGKNYSDARKLLSRVDIDFSQTGLYLSVETMLDRKSGFFKELWNNVSDYSKTLLSKTKLEIDYTIYMPSSVSLELENKFGDLYLNEFKGKCDINITHGNLRANVIHGSSHIEVGYGDVRIKEFKSGVLNLKTTDASIQSLGEVTLNSSSSYLSIKKADQLSLDSRGDKSLRIEEVNRIKGKSLFSKLELEQVNKSIDLNMNYGELKAGSVAFSFSKIDLEGKYTDVSLQFAPDTYLQANITAKEDQLSVPLEGISLDRNYEDEKKRYVNLKGTMGQKNNYPGYLFINSQGGDVSIRLSGIQHSVNK